MVTPIRATPKWNFDLHSGNDEPSPPAFYRLIGSSHYFEITMADPTSYIDYDIDEIGARFND